MNTAIIMLGMNGLATTGALVYVVRRVSPWPKPPAVPGQGSVSSRRPAPAGALAGESVTAAANGASSPADAEAT